jgi:hypothetical protein
MTNPDTRRPIEARLERALADTAIRNVPDGQAVPSYPDQPSRIDRRAPWIAPLLAAAAVVAVVCGSILAITLTSTHHSAPLHGQTATTRPPTASPSQTHATTPAPSSPTPSRSASVTPTRAMVPADWFSKVDVSTLPHPELNCRNDTTPVASVFRTDTVRVSGEAGLLGVAVIACNNATGGWPERVEIFRYSPSGPVLIQLLPEPTDKGLIFVLKLTPSRDRLVVDASGHSAATDQATPDLPFRQTFTWSTSARQFTGGAAIDTLTACTGGQLSTTVTPLSSQSGDAVGLLLVYQNKTDQACTLFGYPGASAVDSGGNVLADAKRTLRGFFGGLSSGTPATVKLTQPAPASAVIEWDAAGSTCVSADHFLTTPPGTTATRPAGTNHSGRWLVCSLTVHPVVFGTSGKK